MPGVQSKTADDRFSPEELREVWPVLSHAERVEGFLLLPRNEAEDFFFSLSAADQAAIVLNLPEGDRRSWMRLLPPDDAADLIQAAPQPAREPLLALLDEADSPGGAGAARVRRGSSGRLDEHPICSPATRDDGRRGDCIPEKAGPPAGRNDLLLLRARLRSTVARGRLLPRAVRLGVGPARA